jgi:hypothetical protein
MPARKTPVRRTAYRPVSETALEVDRNISADASLSRHAVGKSEDTLAADIARIRKIRKPFGAFTQKLALPERHGYHRHWFNDVAGRIDEAKASGWEHVKDQEGKPIKRVVGSGRDKGALYAFAMELPLVFWEEDQKAKHDEAQSKIDEIKKSPFRAAAGQAKKSDGGKFYSPQEDAPLQITTR